MLATDVLQRSVACYTADVVLLSMIVPSQELAELVLVRQLDGHVVATRNSLHTTTSTAPDSASAATAAADSDASLHHGHTGGNQTGQCRSPKPLSSCLDCPRDQKFFHHRCSLFSLSFLVLFHNNNSISWCYCCCCCLSVYIKDLRQFICAFYIFCENFLLN